MAGQAMGAAHGRGIGLGPVLGEPKRDLVCGPLLRYVDRTSAVIWVEVAEGFSEIEVELSGDGPGAPVTTVTSTGWPIRVGDAWYCWIACDWLLPDTWYTYRVIGRRADGSTVTLWPDAKLSGTSLPSVFRTLPTWSFDALRVAYGSCRAGYAPDDPAGAEKGLDAMAGLAAMLAAGWEDRPTRWPHLLLLAGDQIYGDQLSERMKERFRRPELRGDDPDEATTLPQFVELYREAWTATPSVRWLLSVLPSFMIMDDHEQTDDWNITQAWVNARRSPAWIRRFGAGLLAYWLYQGGGNLAPREWLTDERMRPLTPRIRPLFDDATPRLQPLFESYVRGTRRANWSYAFEAAGTRFVVGDTRMTRKLTGHRLLMDDPSWTHFRDLALDHPRRRVVIVVPGPLLNAHPLHDLFSWVADKMENDPSIFDRLETAIVGGAAGALGGALVGGLGGFLVGGPAGALGGAAGGAIVGGAIGFGAGFFLEEILEEFIVGPTIERDIELWPAFPTSFDRMTTLLEDLVDGTGTSPKTFVALVSGDVHFSYVMRGDLLRSRRRQAIHQFTMSPFRQQIVAEDADKVKRIMTGDFSDFPKALQVAQDLGVIYRPGFVDDQMRRLDWYPLKVDGSRADPKTADDFLHFGTFVGHLELEGLRVTSTYDRAVIGAAGGIQLTPVGDPFRSLAM
jgi:PhoD-like phosphatase